MKTYTIDINGIDHTVQLSEADAKARGLTPDPETKQAPAPMNKARKPSRHKV